MQIPTPLTFNPGLLSAADMNKHMRDFAEWLMNPPLLILRKERGRGTLKENDKLEFDFDTVVYDNDGMWDRDKPSRITFRTSGWYLINWQVQWRGLANNTKGHFADQYLSTGAGVKQLVFFRNDFEVYNESHTGYVTEFFANGYYLEFYVTTSGPIGANDPFTVVGYDPPNLDFGHQLEVRWLR